jgi:hypothetical protein
MPIETRGPIWRRFARTGRPYHPKRHNPSVKRSPWLKSDAVGVHSISNPCGNGTVRVLVLSLGHGTHAFVVAGSERPDFPSESEQLLLGVGANQAVIVLTQVGGRCSSRESGS